MEMIIFLVCVLEFIWISYGDTIIYVDGSRSCPCNGTALYPFNTIQDGIDNIKQDNTSIIIKDGTYYTAGIVLNTYYDNIVLRSESGINGVIIDCNQTNNDILGFAVLNSVRNGVLINGITVQSCGNGGLSIQSSNNVHLMNIQLIRNAGINGGGLNINQSSVKLTNVVISDNLALTGGGVYIRSSSLILENQIIISGNNAMYPDSGNEIYCVNSSIIANSVI